MNTPPISPSIDVVETFDAVRYVLRTSNNDRSNLSLGLAFFLRIPVVAALLAAWFLWQSFDKASALLLGISILFVAQMAYVSRLPWLLLRQRLWHKLIDRFGHGEVELRGDRLILGSRVGVFSSGRKKDIREFRRIIVFVYQSAVPNQPQQVDATEDNQSNERVVLAIETNDEKPWLLVDGFSRDETLALATDLHRRLIAVAGRASEVPKLPEPVVIETQQDILYPPLDPNFIRRRKPWWLALHITGAIGLAAITTIAIQTGAWQSPATKTSILMGWILETIILGTTLTLPNRTDPKVSNTKAKDLNMR